MLTKHFVPAKIQKGVFRVKKSFKKSYSAKKPERGPFGLPSTFANLKKKFSTRLEHSCHYASQTAPL